MVVKTTAVRLIVEKAYNYNSSVNNQDQYFPKVLSASVVYQYPLSVPNATIEIVTNTNISTCAYTSPVRFDDLVRLQVSTKMRASEKTVWETIFDGRVRDISSQFASKNTTTLFCVGHINYAATNIMDNGFGTLPGTSESVTSADGSYSWCTLQTWGTEPTGIYNRNNYHRNTSTGTYLPLTVSMVFQTLWEIYLKYLLQIPARPWASYQTKGINPAAHAQYSSTETLAYNYGITYWGFLPDRITKRTIQSITGSNHTSFEMLNATLGYYPAHRLDFNASYIDSGSYIIPMPNDNSKVGAKRKNWNAALSSTIATVGNAEAEIYDASTALAISSISASPWQNYVFDVLAQLEQICNYQYYISVVPLYSSNNKFVTAFLRWQHFPNLMTNKYAAIEGTERLLGTAFSSKGDQVYNYFFITGAGSGTQTSSNGGTPETSTSWSTTGNNSAYSQYTNYGSTTANSNNQNQPSFCGLAQDSDYIMRYGYRCKVLSIPGIYDFATATSIAQYMVTKFRDPEISGSVTLQGTPQAKIGDLVHVKVPSIEINGIQINKLYHVYKIQHTLNGKSFTTDLELTRLKMKPEDYIAAISQQLRFNNMMTIPPLANPVGVDILGNIILGDSSDGGDSGYIYGNNTQLMNSFVDHTPSIGL